MKNHNKEQKSGRLSNKNTCASLATVLIAIISVSLFVFSLNFSVDFADPSSMTVEHSVIMDGFNDEGLSINGIYDTCSLYNVENFEKRLNDGEDLLGCIVLFKIDEVIPDGFFGYTIHTGEHLNFISSDNKNVEAGQEMTVKVRQVDTFLGSFLIRYDMFERQE